MIPLAIAFVAAIGVLVIIKRRELADLQALSVGARLKPGCATAEGVLLLVIAAVLAWLHYTGMLN